MSSCEPVNGPEWVKDLIVYEIAVKGFTSPQGPESGTFRSMQAVLPYLHELGINGIWLTGHSLADPKHFYNIWTQYAVVEPDQIDPSLGTEQDLKDLIAAAHQLDIRIFLDVITHGVMKESPLVLRHPEWFKGNSWGMIDYDFDRHEPELDRWWVGLWTRFVVEYGVDGFRLDLGMRRPDLWQQVRHNAQAVGRSIVLISEVDYEETRRYSLQSGLSNIPPREEYLKAVDFVQRDPDFLLDPAPQALEPNAEIGRADRWGLAQWDGWLARVIGEQDGQGSSRPAWSSVQLSCHDDGWEGFQGATPYVAQGSRFIFGYGALFSGLIPIFMAGEEFNAPFRPLPNLSPFLFGGADPGRGTWLYGGWLQWEALNIPEHSAMLEDVSRMIAIRKQEADVLAAVPNRQARNIRRVPFSADRPCPSPYVRWNQRKAVLVVGNPSAEKDLKLVLKVPLAEMKMARHPLWRIVDLWTGQTTHCTESELDCLECTVARDGTPGGGLRLLRIQPAEAPC